MSQSSSANLRVAGFMVAALAGVISLFPTIVNLSDRVLHRSWEPVDAEITSVRVYSQTMHSRPHSPPTWGLDLICHYEVDGKPYSSVVSPAGTGTTMGDEQAIRAFAARFGASAHHQVLFNPQDPYQALWAPDVQTVLYLWLPWKVAAGALLLLVLLLLWRPAQESASAATSGRES